MRSFSTDTPEFFVFTVDGVEYRVPLAASLPSKTLRDLEDGYRENRSFRVQLEMLRTYMGDIVDELPSSVADEILKAWGEESTKQGASVGE